MRTVQIARSTYHPSDLPPRIRQSGSGGRHSPRPQSPPPRGLREICPGPAAEQTGATTTLILANDATPSGVDLDFHISPATSDIMGNTLDQLIGFTTITSSDGLLGP